MEIHSDLSRYPITITWGKDILAVSSGVVETSGESLNHGNFKIPLEFIAL